MRRAGVVFIGLGVCLGACATSLVSDGAALARSSSGTIGPHQAFVGTVDGTTAPGTIALDCPEAVQPGQMGHPVSGQTIGLRTSSTSTPPAGDTGSRGRSVVVRIAGSNSAAVSTLTFTKYGRRSIPTTGLFPCTGAATVTFSPRPTSSSARQVTLVVPLVSPCSGVCAGLRRSEIR